MPRQVSRCRSDVSVVSFDDDLIASWIKPQLTTLALPHYELGRAAIELLLAAPVTGERRATIHRIPMPLRERESVRNIQIAPERTPRADVTAGSVADR